VSAAGKFRPSPSRARAERWELVEAVAVSIMVGLLVAAVWWLVSGVRQVAALPPADTVEVETTVPATSSTTSTTVPACVGICGPATVVLDTLVPLEDECLDLGNGVGQTRWNLMPCDLPVAAPVMATLPVTGASTDLAAWAVIALVVGLVFIYVRKVLS
jgi:LPXTG-motif cell wall-anchored protein